MCWLDSNPTNTGKFLHNTIENQKMLSSFNAVTSMARIFHSDAQQSLRRSMERLSSGTRINASTDDVGAMSLSMKFSAEIRRSKSTSQNVENALGFLKAQDSILEIADRLVRRMSELLSLAIDPTKSTSDITLYQTEMESLQIQLQNTTNETFNGISLFSPGATGSLDIGINNPDLAPTIAMVSSLNGGQTIGITQSDLEAVSYTVGRPGNFNTIDLTTIPNNPLNIAVYRNMLGSALQFLATMRAHNGAQHSSLMAASDLLSQNQIHGEATVGRIWDVDVANEARNLAVQNIRSQTTLAVISQSNQSRDVLMRLLS